MDFQAIPGPVVAEEVDTALPLLGILEMPARQAQGNQRQLVEQEVQAVVSRSIRNQDRQALLEILGLQYQDRQDLLVLLDNYQVHLE
jgi:hypothetical protein